jgi:hypothetical protein
VNLGMITSDASMGDGNGFLATESRFGRTGVEPDTKLRAHDLPITGKVLDHVTVSCTDKLIAL